MGFRFSKRIKLLPGVRINLSGSGASLSVGPRGASVTMGKRGVHANVGIPGTGLSYRERLDRPSRARTSRPEPPQLPPEITIRLVDDEVRFFDDRGTPLSDALVPIAKKAFAERIRAFMEDNATHRNATIDGLGSIHYDVPRRTRSVGSGTWGKPVIDDFDAHEEFVTALMGWRAAMANSGPDQNSLEQALLDSLGSLEWPFETNIAIALSGGRLLLDVDLPEIEALPASRWATIHRSLRLAEKPVPKQQLAKLYVEHVCSLILRLAGHALATSTAIESVGISAYSQRRASTGATTDEYVAVVEINRAEWAEVDLSQIATIDPQNLLRRHGARIETNARGLLLIQQPLI